MYRPLFAPPSPPSSPEPWRSAEDTICQAGLCGLWPVLIHGTHPLCCEPCPSGQSQHFVPVKVGSPPPHGLGAQPRTWSLRIPVMASSQVDVRPSPRWHTQRCGCQKLPRYSPAIHPLIPNTQVFAWPPAGMGTLAGVATYKRRVAPTLTPPRPTPPPVHPGLSHAAGKYDAGGKTPCRT